MRYYGGQNAPINTDIWGCAFLTNNSEKSMKLKKKPTKGVIKDDGYFYEYKKNGSLKTSGVIKKCCRSYADTEAECIKMYNEKIFSQISILEKLIENCEDELLREVKQCE